MLCAPFHILVDPLCIFTERMSVLSLYPILIILFVFVFEMYDLDIVPSLDIKLLLDKWLAYIFYHVSGCLIILLMVSFALQPPWVFDSNSYICSVLTPVRTFFSLNRMLYDFILSNSFNVFNIPPVSNNNKFTTIIGYSPRRSWIRGRKTDLI